MEHFYQKTAEQLFSELKTSREAGLSYREAVKRLRSFGFNTLRATKKVPLIYKFLAQFKDLLVIILLIAGLIAFLVGESRDALIIVVIVCINAIIGFLQEYKAEKILSAFKKHLPSYSKAIRDGRIVPVFTSTLVPGDIIILEEGDSVGADARLIEAFDLRVNETSLTGESRPVHKHAEVITEEKGLADVVNCVFAGTLILEGEGRAVVFDTGMKTEIGRIAHQSQAIPEVLTPLQKEMIHVGKTVAKIALVVAVCTLILFRLIGRDFHESILFTIAAATAVVPEGLPAAMSIALSLGAERMLKRKALVKKLLHVETLGSVTVICTDKTGTITTGNMSVSEVVSERKDDILKTMVLCNNTELTEKIGGDPLEKALLAHAAKSGVAVKAMQTENRKVYEVPFTSERKMMSVVCIDGDGAYSYVKGSCPEIIAKCHISEGDKDKVLAQNDQMAKRGLRVLAFAIKRMGEFHKSQVEENLDFLGLVGLEDPPREGVKKALETCRKASIKVFMVTGDYGLTAKSIAEQVGLATSETLLVTGEELHQMDDEKLRQILNGEVIFARIDPGQKLRIVGALQEMGEVVAVTGDGVNDVPALVKADIGVSMGIIGTEVAKEAADMVLLDDHFATIVNAIREGRRIFDNAKKFVFYVFSSNSGELLAPLFGVILGLPLPLIAIQILAIDLGTDVFPSLALGLEKAEPDIMTGPARSKTERIMNKEMLWRLLLVGLLMGVFGLIVFVLTLKEGGWHYGQMLSEGNLTYRKAMAATYATIVFCQVANAFSCRSERQSIWQRGIFSNPWLILSEVVSFTMLWLIMNFEPIQDVFRTSAPTPFAWKLIYGSGIIFLLTFELLKFRRRKRARLAPQTCAAS